MAFSVTDLAQCWNFAPSHHLILPASYGEVHRPWGKIIKFADFLHCTNTRGPEPPTPAAGLPVRGFRLDIHGATVYIGRDG
jgi:hypothetical protein